MALLQCLPSASRARRWVKQGKATEHWNDAGLYYVQHLTYSKLTKSRQP